MEPRLQTVYEQIGGETIEKLVQAFYPKVYADPDLIPIFQGDMSEIMRKQKMFLTQFTGGPAFFYPGIWSTCHETSPYAA